MKTLGIISTATLSLLLAYAVPAYAQQDQHDKQEEKRPQEEKREQPAKPSAGEKKNAKRGAKANKQAQEAGKRDSQSNQAAKREQDNRPAHAQGNQEQRAEQPRNDQPRNDQRRNDRPLRQPEPKQQTAERHNSPQPKPSAQEKHVQQSAWQQHRAQNWKSDHRTWQQRGGYIGYRIPDDRFRGSFGSGHGFRIDGLPFLVIGGYPRFQYSGYWFSLVDPWPEEWANDWYDTDDVYVAYVDNGYYLFDRRYPTVGIAINISL